MKFDASQLPPKIESKEAEAIVRQNRCDPEFEEEWIKTITMSPNWKHMKAYLYENYITGKRRVAIDKLIETVPDDTYHKFEDDSYCKDTDFYMVVRCACGNEIVFSELDIKHLCIECGRVYSVDFSAKQSDYLREG